MYPFATGLTPRALSGVRLSPSRGRAYVLVRLTHRAGNATPAISFSPAGNAGDLWALDESGGDQSGLNTAGRVVGQQTWRTELP
jgi:hypothetical protein